MNSWPTRAGLEFSQPIPKNLRLTDAMVPCELYVYEWGLVLLNF